MSKIKDNQIVLNRWWSDVVTTYQKRKRNIENYFDKYDPNQWLNEEEIIDLVLRKNEVLWDINDMVTFKWYFNHVMEVTDNQIENSIVLFDEIQWYNVPIEEIIENRLLSNWSYDSLEFEISPKANQWWWTAARILRTLIWEEVEKRWLRKELITFERERLRYWFASMFCWIRTVRWRKENKWQILKINTKRTKDFEKKFELDFFTIHPKSILLEKWSSDCDKVKKVAFSKSCTFEEVISRFFVDWYVNLDVVIQNLEEENNEVIYYYTETEEVIFINKEIIYVWENPYHCIPVYSAVLEQDTMERYPYWTWWIAYLLKDEKKYVVEALNMDLINLKQANKKVLRMDQNTSIDSVTAITSQIHLMKFDVWANWKLRDWSDFIDLASRNPFNNEAFSAMVNFISLRFWVDISRISSTTDSWTAYEVWINISRESKALRIFIQDFDDIKNKVVLSIVMNIRRFYDELYTKLIYEEWSKKKKKRIDNKEVSVQWELLDWELVQTQNKSIKQIVKLNKDIVEWDYQVEITSSLKFFDQSMKNREDAKELYEKLLQLDPQSPLYPDKEILEKIRDNYFKAFNMTTEDVQNGKLIHQKNEEAIKIQDEITDMLKSLNQPMMPEQDMIEQMMWWWMWWDPMQEMMWWWPQQIMEPDVWPDWEMNVNTNPDVIAKKADYETEKIKARWREAL